MSAETYQNLTATNHLIIQIWQPLTFYYPVTLLDDFFIGFRFDIDLAYVEYIMHVCVCRWWIVRQHCSGSYQAR